MPDTVTLDPGVILSQLLNWAILAAVLAVVVTVPVLVARDARRRGDTLAHALGWGLATLALLPLGLTLYLLLGRRARGESDEAA